MNFMLRILLREILIFIGCLLIFPVAVIVLLIYGGSLDWGLMFIVQGVLPIGMVLSPETVFMVGSRLIAPYLMVQTLRALRWSQRSLTGRRWANLYFFGMLVTTGGWFFWQAWDLFYFMYALGDIPSELGQFLAIEGKSVVVFLGCMILGFYCFSIFLNPRRRHTESETDQQTQPSS
jgi:hypothetical protein